VIYLLFLFWSKDHDNYGLQYNNYALESFYKIHHLVRNILYCGEFDWIYIYIYSVYNNVAISTVGLIFFFLLYFCYLLGFWQSLTCRNVLGFNTAAIGKKYINCLILYFHNINDTRTYLFQYWAVRCFYIRLQCLFFSCTVCTIIPISFTHIKINTRCINITVATPTTSQHV
jgi:hypothetical protein